MHYLPDFTVINHEFLNQTQIPERMALFNKMIVPLGRRASTVLQVIVGHCARCDIQCVEILSFIEDND